MPTFDTQGPVALTVELMCGNVTITAEDRADAEVTVEPTNPDDDSDVQAAEQTRIEYGDGGLTVKNRTPLWYVAFGNKSRSVDVTVTLPFGSDVSGVASLAQLKAAGRLGNCEFKSGMGRLQFGETASVRLKTHGDVVVERAEGDAELHTGSGKIRLGRASRSATVKNSNGSSWIGEAGGVVKARASNGDVVVDRAETDVDAASANGSVKIGRLSGGSANVKTASGAIDVGIPEGVAAWVDAQTGYGNVRNLLDGVGEPAPDQPVAKIHARNSYGDIVIRRA